MSGDSILKSGESFQEDVLLAHIHDTVPGATHVLVGPGDDMALIRVGGGELLAAKDLLVEGRHFLAWQAWRKLAAKPSRAT